MATKPRRAKGARSTALLAEVRGFVFDIDGTLALADSAHEGHQALPGARAVLRRLREAAIPFAAFTNGTIYPPREIARSLRRAGLDLRDDEVLTPASVAATHFRKHGIRSVLALGGNGLVSPLKEAGIAVVQSPQRADNADAVLIGWHPRFGLRDLETACHAVWAGAALFTASNAPYFANAGGRTLGVSGAIAAAIRSVTGIRARLLGKPAAHGLRMASQRMGVPSSQLAVVGDDPSLETVMARAAGALAIAVCTGLANSDAVARLPKRMRPDLVLPGLKELLDILRGSGR